MNVRPATADDFDAMLELLLEEEEQVNGRPATIGLEDLRTWLSSTDLEHDSYLFESDGGLAAFGWCEPEPGGDVSVAIGAIRPGWKGRGLGSQLLERAEARARTHGAGRLHQIVLGRDDRAPQLLQAQGYREVRRFYEMAIQLEQAPTVPDLPIETFREEDARAFHDALDESFQDHWEHHGVGFDEWWRRHTSRESFDPSLWFLIRDGGEVAAVVRNDANRNGGGYVGALGVRRLWRGRGYAKALLLRSFREFFDRGMPRVTLGVDAENPTGATHLYERVGMHVEAENVVWEKALA
ncbi:MAG TPA: GNAT family N-acetyltransferase [Gaiellaceae bacterium]|nr:GNAT family N-acetyltransferase [Gaiellaceae bacterium]